VAEPPSGDSSANAAKSWFFFFVVLRGLRAFVVPVLVDL
jgi:hypothetical protein